jgi:hypothetical protein
MPNQQNHNDSPSAKQAAETVSAMKAYLNPIVVLATAMLAAIVVLIGATMLGLDKGLVLTRMGQVEFARGLITYLFAVVTIGTAVVLVVSALTSEETPAHEQRFQRGKEILSLLLGVFGTIVGFYFGSEVTSKAGAEERMIKVIPIRLSATTVPPGGQFTLTTYVAGGKTPYKYGVGFDSDDIKPAEPVDASGWIIKTLAAPKSTEEKAVTAHVVVEDADGHSTTAIVPLVLKPGP